MSKQNLQNPLTMLRDLLENATPTVRYALLPGIGYGVVAGVAGCVLVGIYLPELFTEFPASVAAIFLAGLLAGVFFGLILGTFVEAVIVAGFLPRVAMRRRRRKPREQTGAEG